MSYLHRLPINVVITTLGVLSALLSPGFLRADPACVEIEKSVTLSAQTRLVFQLGGTTACTEFDRFTVNQDLSLNDAELAVDFISGYQPGVGDQFLIVVVGQNLTGQFSTAGQLTAPDGTVFSIDYAAGDGNDIALTTTAIGGLLPVTFREFNGARNGKQVDLWWSTSREVGNEHFTVERATGDATDFVPLSRVPSRGASETTQRYATIDDAPAPGANYYRLRQTDFDGTGSVFPRLVVVTLPDESISVSPNPVSTSAKIHLPEWLGEEPVPVSIYAADGRLLRTWRQRPGTDVHFSPADLPSGTYQLRAGSGDQTPALPLVIIR